MNDNDRFRISASDDSTEEERRAEYANFLKNQNKREKREKIYSVFGKTFKIVAIVFGIGFSAFLIISILLHVRLIRDVSVTLEAVEWTEGDQDSAVIRTVTLSGEVQDYLIDIDSAKLEFQISGYTPVPPKIESHGYVYISGKYGKNTQWNGPLIQIFFYDATEEIISCDGPWYDPESGIYFMYIMEKTAKESFSYIPGEKGRLMAFGCTDAVKAEQTFQKARAEDRLQFAVWPPIPASN